MNIKVKDIIADENQPRRYFPADKMKVLKESIRKHGVLSPITVQDLGNSKYLLVDGERRFRSVVELNLKEVPATVEAQTSDADRLVHQFHLQEMHEGWTPIEKAIAVQNLSTALNLSLKEAAKMTGATESDISRYIKFAEIVDKANYVKNEIPLDYAPFYRQLRNQAKLISLNELQEAFPLSSEKAVEHRLTEMIKEGTVKNRRDLVRIKDAMVKEPKMLAVFMSGKKITPDEMYLQSKAQGAAALRRTVQSSQYVRSHGEVFLKLKDVKVSDRQIDLFKQARETLDQLIALKEF